MEEMSSTFEPSFYDLVKCYKFLMAILGNSSYKLGRTSVRRGKIAPFQGEPCEEDWRKEQYRGLKRGFVRCAQPRGK